MVRGQTAAGVKEPSVTEAVCTTFLTGRTFTIHFTSDLWIRCFGLLTSIGAATNLACGAFATGAALFYTNVGLTYVA